jgi:23S rRNA U2552 (ribose-2'-O)-methylase RlmE/FtsJ
MVKKLILEISEIDSQIDSQIDILLNTNNDLYDLIIKYKNKITEYYNNKAWDRFKKLSNEYENIFTTPNTNNNISKFNPVSRSFFKMWEILHDFKDEFDFDNINSIKVAGLGEAPGGFSEAIIKYRSNIVNSDKYYGISLKCNNNKSVPNWKLYNKFVDKVDINYGADNTGDLYNFQNIIHFVNHVGKHSVDLITADGGFDFSSDFNHQEDMSMQLIFCEVLTALLLQKDNGAFILKIYDIFTPNTIKLIHLLKKFYKKINIVKPLTSRPANSEKYLVCFGFNNPIDSKIYLEKLYKIVIFKKEIPDELDIEYNANILNNLVAYNTYYTMRQVFYIQRTIDYINLYKMSNRDDKSMNMILEDNKRKSIKWCKKYNI